MNENNELNDIILNKSGSTNNNKKIILAVATLGIILIVVVMLMNSLTSNGTDNLPQTPIPPEPKISHIEDIKEEALFEEVEVIEESQEDTSLDNIAARLKEESEETIEEEIIEPIIIPKPIVKKTILKPKVVSKPKKSVHTITYFVQVGSFTKYAPNKKFLDSISKLGYKYKFHKITRNAKPLNKVLVGPFGSSIDAKKARRIIRAKIEPGAFLVRL